MNKLFNGLEYMRTYIDDLSIISRKSVGDHINKLDKVQSRLKQKGFKVKEEISFFARNELEYVRFMITRQGIIPLFDKVEAIKNIAVYTTKTELRSFIGSIDHYRDM